MTSEITVTQDQITALAMLLHLSQRSEELKDGDFKDGFDAAIEETAAYVELETH